MFSKITKWFTRQKEEEFEVKECDGEQPEFKTFSETYKIVCFALSIGLMYPNPRTRMLRLYGMFAVMISVAPIASAFLIDIYFCMLRRDIVELIRHSTVLGPFLAGFLKMLFMIWKQTPAFALITEINRDYAMYNEVAPEYKEIVRASLKNNLIYSQGWWTVNVIGTIMTFPVMAAVLTLYSYMFDEKPQRYMAHELNKPWNKDPEARWESPYYELTNVYMFYCAWIYVLNFLGYDGFFGLSINHGCLKIEMYCKAIEDAMKYPDQQVYERIAWVIQEQNRTYNYIDQIQDAFNMWLGVIFLATIIQVCNLLYLISEGYGLDVRYMIFITGVTVHIFLPCHYSAKLKAKSFEVANHFYCSGWENVHDEKVRKMIVFMIARAQIPVELKAVGMITFDMELFVSILQTSYSMYTLLSS